MMAHDESGIILGYVWPRLTRCPFCGSDLYTESGSNGKTIRYRFCANSKRPSCKGREQAYKVVAIAVHVDAGGDQSEVRPI